MGDFDSVIIGYGAACRMAEAGDRGFQRRTLAADLLQRDCERLVERLALKQAQFDALVADIAREANAIGRGE